ncbi:major facilitator superfamily domain-containing protein [Triangularia setosa]|uniref:Major facilitator superfamily domain-containing protein n=1 Tax=Triangularia setosa TaxID=2587417 RepID=A0AAN7ABV6_9PEZI|nr:major facilitator superfamily domain-containing protein [Podospora setosa]
MRSLSSSASSSQSSTPIAKPSPATEQTPLLLPTTRGDATFPGSLPPTINSSPSHDAPPAEEPPFPTHQILLLCLARLLEPIAFFSIFPYINKMAQENGYLPDTDVGFYSGLIESLFSLTQMFVMIFWGRASDRLGRKPVLVVSIVGVSLATMLFGAAKTIAEMIVYRCAAGVFAGNVVTIRTMISEQCGQRSKNQAKAFSWFSIANNLGISIGPLLGGVLAEPVRQYPGLFKGWKWLERYPYVLSSLVIGGLGLVCAVVVGVWVEETLDRGKEGGDGRKVERMTVWELMKSPGVTIVLVVNGWIMLLAYSYTAILPVFWFTKVELGGFGFSPVQISWLMGLTGLSQAVWMLAIFPPLQARIGTNGVMRVCAKAYPFFFALGPAFSMLLRTGKPGLVTVFWVLAPVFFCLGSGVSMSFTAIQLAVSDVAPSTRTLGTLTSISQAVVSGMRSFSPATFASLFALSVKAQWLLEGYSIWVLMVAIAFGFTVLSFRLPDYEQLKKERESRSEEETQRLLD